MRENKRKTDPFQGFFLPSPVKEVKDKSKGKSKRALPLLYMKGSLKGRSPFIKSLPPPLAREGERGGRLLKDIRGIKGIGLLKMKGVRGDRFETIS